jgi:hypothetical protein
MDTQELRKTIEAVTAERDAISGALAQLQREHEALKQEFGAQQLELRELRKVVAQSHALLGSASAAPRSTAPFNEEKKKGALSARATAPLNEDKKMGALSARAAPISPPNPPAATGKSISPEEAIPSLVFPPRTRVIMSCWLVSDRPRILAAPPHPLLARRISSPRSTARSPMPRPRRSPIGCRTSSPLSRRMRATFQGSRQSKRTPTLHPVDRLAGFDPLL